MQHDSRKLFVRVVVEMLACSREAIYGFAIMGTAHTGIYAHRTASTAPLSR